MDVTTRPALDRPHDRGPVDDVVASLQAGIDEGDADRFNERFAADVLWGSPFGAVIEGYDAIHAIHESMFGPPPDGSDAPRATYTVEHVRFPTDDVALAYVRRTTPAPTGDLEPGRSAGFDELALFVLVRRDDRWWLSAGLHTPDRRAEMYG